MNGYDAEIDAAQLFCPVLAQTRAPPLQMKDVEQGVKVRVLLAQALFGNPDISFDGRTYQLS